MGIVGVKRGPADAFAQVAEVLILRACRMSGVSFAEPPYSSSSSKMGFSCGGLAAIPRPIVPKGVVGLGGGRPEVDFVGDWKK